MSEKTFLRLNVTAFFKKWALWATCAWSVANYFSLFWHTRQNTKSERFEPSLTWFLARLLKRTRDTLIRKQWRNRWTTRGLSREWVLRSWLEEKYCKSARYLKDLTLGGLQLHHRRHLAGSNGSTVKSAARARANMAIWFTRYLSQDYSCSLSDNSDSLKNSFTFVNISRNCDII